MTWSAVIRWGDRVVRVSGIDVTIEQRIDLSAREGGYNPTRLSVDCILPFDAAAYMYGDEVDVAQASVVILDETDEPIRTYPVIGITPGRDGEVTSFEVGNRKLHSASQIPRSVTGLVVQRVNVARTNRKRGNIADRIARLQESLATGYQVRLSSSSLVYLENTYEKHKRELEYLISRRNFVSFDPKVEGRTYPLIVGKPGRCSDTTDKPIRAITVSMVDDVNERLMIGGHVATLGTCQLFGPKLSDPEKRANAQITQAIYEDQGGKQYTGFDVTGSATFAVPPDSDQKDWYACYAGTQTAEGLPADVGSVLALMMGHAARVRVDYPRFAELSSRLPSWLLDGVVDEVTSAWGLISSSLLPILPVGLVDGPNGIMPVYTGTIRDQREVVHRLTEGPHFAGLGAPSLSSASSVYNDVTLKYAYDAASREYRRDVHLTGIDALYLRKSQGTYGYRPLEVETAWCYDVGTAAGIASTIAHRHHRQMMTLEYLATPALHGPGGESELVIGDLVRITDARWSISDRMAIVTRVARSPARLVIGLTIIHSAVVDYTVPPAVTVYAMFTEDPGGTTSASRWSEDGGVTWTSVSGLPAEGILEAAVHDGDNGRFLLVGSSGAAMFASNAGTTVTDIAIGGTANRYGCCYRPASAAGGALYAVAGNAGRYDYSTDGTTWTNVSGFGTIGLYIAYHHDGYIYVGGNSGRMWYSSSGTGGFTSCNTTGISRNTDMTWTGVNLVVCRRSGNIAYATPANARAGTWTAPSSGTANDLNAVVSDGAGTVVAVGLSGTITRSIDHGATWATQTSGTANDLLGATYTGTEYIAVGASGTVITSTDGATWSAQTSGTSNDLTWVAASGGYE